MNESEVFKKIFMLSLGITFGLNITFFALLYIYEISTLFSSVVLSLPVTILVISFILYASTEENEGE